MRRIYLVAIMVFAMLSVCNAQDYRPTTVWPYRYDDFAAGELVFKVGGGKSGKFNIYIPGNKLHFLDGEMIKSVSSSEVAAVKIGSDYYRNVDGEILKVLAKSDKALIVEELSINETALNSTGGAYGSSSASDGTMALSSLEGIGGTRTNMNHMELKNDKDAGKMLPLIKKTYIFVKGNKIYATKRDVMSIKGVNSSEVKSFIKKNHIRWKDPQSLLILADFLSDQF
ncbi:MAG: hypothetical protein LKI42_03450 [Bacteroidales bacterium]|jgi:hypothetical protein|nr:hypothetical protein [Bacteroidales bacterium]MCI1785709.1 hypothetical protein [Bacteroidales bacterium]